MATQQKPFVNPHKQFSSHNSEPPRVDLNSYKAKINDWITKQIDDKTIEFADIFGKQIANSKTGMSTSQIRNVFGEMRRIQMNGYTSQKPSFLLLKAKLAYAVKRNKNKGIEDFFRLFEIAYGDVDKQNDENGEKHFENLMNLMEAVLAYHKYHGGKE